MFKGVHDSEVVAYSVDSRTDTLVLILTPGTGSARQDFRLVFRGVLAHQFMYPQLPAIVLDLEEVPAAKILGKEWANISEGARQCGWPGPWATSLEAAMAHCETLGLKGYELDQSYGMSGWLLAKSVEFVDGA
jgi:hypothetical protein